MVKIFTKNKDGKIELTEEELKSILDESYWEGYRKSIFYYATPNVLTNDVWKNDITWTSLSTSSSVTLRSPEESNLTNKTTS